MCPFLVAMGVITVDPSKSGAGFYWGGTTVEQNEHPKDQFLRQISRKEWAYLLPYKMVKFLGTIKSPPPKKYI